jgi:four helix bundle protein
MHNFKELKVWQNARKIVKEIYLDTKDFPSDEKFGLISQMRRSAVSIPSNIAEGSGRNTDKDFKYFLNVALGSAYELQTLLFLSQDVGLMSQERVSELSTLLEEVQKMIYGLIKTIKVE